MPARSSASAAGRPPMPLVGQVDEQQVVVGAAGDEVEAALEQRLGERGRVGHDGARVVGELRLRRLVQRDRDRGDGVVVRAALQAREDGPVDRLRVLRPGTSASPRAARAASCAWSSRRRRRGRPATGARRRRSARRCARRRRPAPRRPRARSARTPRSRSVRGIAVPPHQISFGRSRSASSRTSSRSTVPGVAPDAVAHGPEPLARSPTRPSRASGARRPPATCPAPCRRAPGTRRRPRGWRASPRAAGRWRARRRTAPRARSRRQRARRRR